MRRRLWPLLLALTPVLGCGGSGTEAAAAQSPPLYRVPVERYTIAAERFTDGVDTTGLLEAEHDVTLTAEVAGTVHFVAEPIGTVIEAGGMVVELDPTDLELALAQAEGALARVEAAYAKAQDDVRTDSNLVTHGLAPERQATAMQFAEQMSAAAIREARAQRDLARRRVEKARLRSPMRAMLSETLVDVGEWIAPGTPVARVVGIETVRAVVHLPEATVARVQPGQEAWIVVDTFPRERFGGAVESVSPTASPTTRTFAVKVRLPNDADRRLRPGMAARVRIVTHALPDVRIVPLDAVADLEGGPHVYRLENGPDGVVVRAQPVTLGLQVGRRVQLLDGPAAGTAIAASSVSLLLDGRPVEVVEREPPA